MQLEIMSVFVLLAIVLVVALIPFIILGRAEKKTRELKGKFERGEIPLDPDLVPPIVDFYGSLLRSRKKYATAVLFSFSYALLILNVSALMLFGSAITLTPYQVLLLVIGVLILAIRAPDPTGGLGESWQAGLDKIEELRTT